MSLGADGGHRVCDPNRHSNTAVGGCLGKSIADVQVTPEAILHGRVAIGFKQPQVLPLLLDEHGVQAHLSCPRQATATSSRPSTEVCTCLIFTISGLQTDGDSLYVALS